MKSIENGFLECYFLEDGRVYNINTNKYLKPYNNIFKLKTSTGEIKSISLKKLYKLVFNKVYCVDNITNIEGEIWKEIKDTDGNYFISSYGRVKSYTGYQAVILKPATTATGYKRLQIVQKGILVNKLVHRLVASAFLLPPKSIDEIIHHKDNNRKNNRADNLEWLSVAEHKKIHNEMEKGDKQNKDEK